MIGGEVVVGDTHNPIIKPVSFLHPQNGLEKKKLISLLGFPCSFQQLASSTVKRFCGGKCVCSCMSCLSLILILEGSLSSPHISWTWGHHVRHVMVFSFILRIGFQKHQNDDPFMDYLQNFVKNKNQTPAWWLYWFVWLGISLFYIIIIIIMERNRWISTDHLLIDLIGSGKEVVWCWK